MEDFDDVIFDDDEFSESPLNEQEQQITTDIPLDNLPNNIEEDEGDLTADVLKLRGILDPNKIKFEDESGAIIERSWDALSRDELINILANQEEPELDLDNDEIELLNSIRSSGMGVKDFMNSLLKKEPETPHYKIDDLSDEDVYALDLLDKIGSDNITDEELAEAISKAKENQDLFDKTVEGLRKEYIRLQQDEEELQQKQKEEEYTAQYNLFASSITNEIRGLNKFMGQNLELSNEDSEELARFILEIDNNGTSSLGKYLLDPAKLTKAAFFVLNEDKITEELTKLMQDSYKRGYDMAKSDIINKTKVVINPRKQTQKSSFNFDEDEWA